MNKPSPVSLVPLALLLLSGAALAQTVSAPNPSGVDADRVNRRCPTATLSTDASAPCSDDVLYDGPAPAVVRPPGNASAGPTGTFVGTTGTLPTGTVNPGSVTMPGATAAGAAPANGAVRPPATR